MGIWGFPGLRPLPPRNAVHALLAARALRTFRTFLPCESGLHRRTASSQGPASALRFNYYPPVLDAAAVAGCWLRARLLKAGARGNSKWLV